MVWHVALHLEQRKKSVTIGGDLSFRGAEGDEKSRLARNRVSAAGFSSLRP